jgi:hypothetical protein
LARAITVKDVARTRSASTGSTVAVPLTTRDTVMGETAAARATSLTVMARAKEEVVVTRWGAAVQMGQCNGPHPGTGWSKCGKRSMLAAAAPRAWTATSK